MKTIISLVILATFLTKPVLAGEVFVFNQWRMRQSRTEVDSNIDSTIYSTRNEDYNISTNKIYIDGKVETRDNNGEVKTSSDNFTIHYADSYINGSFYEDKTTRVWGTIKTITNSYTNSHESSAGIR